MVAAQAARGETTQQSDTITVRPLFTLSRACSQVPNDPDLQYFVQRNPGFAAGDKLMVLVPLTICGMLHLKAKVSLSTTTWVFHSVNTS